MTHPMTPEQIAAKAHHDFRREHYREGPCWEDIDWGHQERWVLSMKAALAAIQPVPAPDLVERVSRAMAEAHSPAALMAWEAGATEDYWPDIARAIIPIIQAEPHGLCARCAGVIVPFDWEQQLRDVRADEREACNEVVKLINELIGKESSKQFYGINSVLSAKLGTIRLTAIRERNGRD